MYTLGFGLVVFVYSYCIVCTVDVRQARSDCIIYTLHRDGEASAVGQAIARPGHQ